jgi:hypothetical protein
MGPGLDDDIQETNIEDAHMYTGPEKYEMWDPYGGGGEDREYDVPGRKKSPKKSSVFEGKSVVGIDFDGTVTADPGFFKKLVRELRGAGSRVHLITGRSAAERAEVEEYCSRHGLKFDGVHYYPIPYHHDWVAWDTLLEVRIGSWKARVLDDIGAEVMIEDNPVFIRQIVRRNPGIYALMPVGGQDK